MSDASDKLQSIREVNSIFSDLSGEIGKIALIKWIGHEAGLKPEDTSTAVILMDRFVAAIRAKYSHHSSFERLLHVHDNMLLHPEQQHTDVPELLFNDMIAMAREYKQQIASAKQAGTDVTSIVM